MDNENTRSFEIVVTPTLRMQAYYTLGVHDNPRWYCFLQYRFSPFVKNRNSKKDEDDSRFDITIPSECFIMELTLSEGTDFDSVLEEGKKECDKILKNIPMTLTMNSLFNGKKLDNTDRED